MREMGAFKRVKSGRSINNQKQNINRDQRKHAQVHQNHPGRHTAGSVSEEYLVLRGVAGAGAAADDNNDGVWKRCRSFVKWIVLNECGV